MRERAPFGKVMGALLVAAIAAPLAGGLIFSFLLGRTIFDGFGAIPFVLVYALVLGFPIALILALGLGLPAFLWLERRYRIRWWSAAIAGAVVGALPMALWNLRALTDEGVGILLFIGASGAVGGLVFWAALRDLMRTP